MGLKAVLNDTPEKRQARDEFLVLVGDSAFRLSSNPSVKPNGFIALIRLAARAGLTDERISELSDDVFVPASIIATWHTGYTLPDPAWQRRLVAQMKVELERVASAVEHD